MLTEAIENEDDAQARDLIDRGAGFDLDGKPLLSMGSSMLHLAIRSRLENLAFFLIQTGADIHATNENGRMPLAVAAMKGLGRVVTALLDAGADPQATDRFGHSARTYADTNSAAN